VNQPSHPSIRSLVGEATANVGTMLFVGQQLREALEPVKNAVEANMEQEAN
jgi:hypothetical protein